VNATNTNNFGLVNSNGTANNNNAYNSYGVPPLISRKVRSKAVAERRTTVSTKGETLPSAERRKKSQPMSVHGRFLHGGGCA